MLKGDKITALPRGFRFRPTDEELFCYYLKRKITSKASCLDPIGVVDVYRFEPWELPAVSKFKIDDGSMCYFFVPLDRKYSSGIRTNRATEMGYWKFTGKDRQTRINSRIVGFTKILVYYRGRAPKGERTDWVMHEYRLADAEVEKGVVEDWFVLCRIWKKSGPGPRAPFVEEDWDGNDDDVSVVTSDCIVAANEMSYDEITSLPCGYRFMPTDEELVCYYLKRKIMKKASSFDPIASVDIYEFEPWDLPALSMLKSDESVWYFFNSLDDKAKGVRTSRTTKNGFWKVTGKDRKIRINSRIVGIKKTLVHYHSQAARAECTGWKMREYRLADEEVGNYEVKDWFELCKIKQNSRLGLKHKEQFRVPFVEEDQDDDDEDEPCVLNEGLSVTVNSMCDRNLYGVDSLQSFEENVLLLRGDMSQSSCLLHDNIEDEYGVDMLQSSEENDRLMLPDEGQRYGFNEHSHLNPCLLLHKSPTLNLLAENLVKLKLTHSLVEQLWEGKPYLVNLETMDLNLTKINELPDLSECVKLERLNLQGCTSLISALPIEHLTSLVWLNLKDCTRLILLPSMINLTILLTLDLSGCGNLTELPELSRSIKYLHLSGAGVTELPTSIGNLSNLMELNLRNCRRLKRLPNSICKLTALENLNVSGCSALYSF